MKMITEPTETDLRKVVCKEVVDELKRQERLQNIFDNYKFYLEEGVCSDYYGKWYAELGCLEFLRQLVFCVGSTQTRSSCEELLEALKPVQEWRIKDVKLLGELSYEEYCDKEATLFAVLALYYGEKLEEMNSGECVNCLHVNECQAGENGCMIANKIKDELTLNEAEIQMLIARMNMVARLGVD